MKEVICIKDHSMKYVKKGEIYSLLNTMSVTCHCGPKLLYDVGIKSKSNGGHYAVCIHCGYKVYISNDTTWIHHSLFTEAADISELTEILSREVAI